MQILFSLYSFHDNQVASLISGLLEDIKRSSTSVITSTYVQNIRLSNYVFGSEHDARKCFIHILDKCFPDIDQSIFKTKVSQLYLKIQMILSLMMAVIAH